ncbi:tripartite tricarboxylate transporter substrate binding protein [Variovorax dokdonensis]|uniref:Tripartite tricarboxylate transporter substrate binding protein n=1 Tax=Variovorax dokdonensis TaxID=344883 RepID=A0ABT7N921_9BURK|nr:tripartite tricarboxylate transporter substrate binding protein [Variovorax dokdonensis]MDM0044445.1 tripartite tricarboxylate transporter substrate binding protein [Variovorax dokdonensis]
MNWMPTRRQALIAAGAGAVVGSAGRAWAQSSYPSRPVHIVAPFTPGGSSDLLARAIGQALSQGWNGQAAVIENVPGAGGSVGSEKVARSPADGYMLLMGHTGTLAVNPSLYPRLGYDPVKSFAPVAMVARVPNVLVVHPSVPARNLAELVALSKAQPEKLAYGSGGNGSAAHISTEYLKLKTGASLMHVPYRGTAPSVTDLLAGQVQVLFTGAPALLQHIRAGKMRALAVSSLQRLPQLPDVPTVAESGVPGTKGFEADQWYGLVAPAGTPVAIVTQLNAEVNRALQSPEVQNRLSAEGALAAPMSPQAFGQLIAQEIDRWRQVVKAANVKVE